MESQLCQFCGKNFNSQDVYLKHLGIEHPDLVQTFWLKCDICPTYCPTDDDLKVHVASAHNVETSTQFTNLVCNFCPESFSKRIAMYRHANKVHADSLPSLWVKCQECKFYLPSDDKLNLHMKIRHYHKCHFCTGAYSRPIKMYEHAIRTHILEVSRLWIKCSECYLHLPTQVSLVRHLKEDHSKKKSRTCKVCGLGDLTVHSWLKHVNSEHYSFVQARWYECKICQNFYPSTRALKFHLRVRHFCLPAPNEETSTSTRYHTAPNPQSVVQTQQNSQDQYQTTSEVTISTIFQCQFCAAEFEDDPIQYFEHANRLHQDDVPNFWIICNLCDYYFPTDEDLQSHLATCSGPQTEDARSEIEAYEVVEFHIEDGVQFEVDDSSNVVIVEEASIFQNTVAIGQNYEVIAEFDPFTSNQIHVNAAQSNVDESKPLQSNQVQIQSNPVIGDPVETKSKLLQPNLNIQTVPCYPDPIPATPVTNLHCKAKLQQPHPVQSSTKPKPVPDQLTSSPSNPASGKPTPTCHICQKTFQRNSYLYVHLREAHRPPTETGPICKVCNLETRGKGALRLHMMRIHGMVVPVSQRMRTKIPDEDILLIDPKELENVEKSEPQNVLCSAYKVTPECGICLSSFADRAKLKEHLKEFHGLVNETNLFYQPKKKAKTSFLHFLVPNSKLDKLKMKNKGRGSDFDRLEEEVEYDEHGRDVELEAPRPPARKSVYYFKKSKRNTPSKCDICNISFSNKNSQIWHMVRVHRECNSRLVIPILKPEMRQEAPILEKDGVTTRLKLACHVCQQTFRFASSLKRHLKWQHKESYVPSPNTRTDGPGKCVIHPLSGKKAQKNSGPCGIKLIDPATGNRSKKKGMKSTGIKETFESSPMTTVYCNSPSKRPRLSSGELFDPLAGIDLKEEIESDQNYAENDNWATKTLLCTACYEIIDDESGLKSHWEREHNLKELSIVLEKVDSKVFKPQINMSGVSLAHFSSLKKHLNVVHGQGTIDRDAAEHNVKLKEAPVEQHVECAICQIKFKFEASLKRHVKWVHKTPVEEASQTVALENVECVMGEVPACTSCHTSFTRNCSLKKHLMRRHGMDLSAVDKIMYPERSANEATRKPRSTCSLCQASFSLHSSLQRHLKRTHGLSFETITSMLKREKLAEQNVEIETSSPKENSREQSSQETESLATTTEPDLQHTANETADKTETHQNAEPKTSQPKATCTLCQVTFTQGYSLTRHLQRIHHLDDETIEAISPRQRRRKQPKRDKELLDTLTEDNYLDRSVEKISDTKSDESCSKQKKALPLCTICQVPFTQVHLLQEHLKQTHGLETVANETEANQEEPLSEAYIKEEVEDLEQNEDPIQPELTEEEKLAVRCPICLKQIFKAYSMKRHLLEIHMLDEDYANDVYARENLEQQYNRYNKYRKELGEPKKIDQKVILDPEILQPTCTMCQKSFIHYQGLRKHLRNVHNFDDASLENYFKLANLAVQGTIKVGIDTGPVANQEEVLDTFVDVNFFETNEDTDTDSLVDNPIEPSDNVAATVAYHDFKRDDFKDPNFQADDSEHDKSVHSRPKKQSPNKSKGKMNEERQKTAARRPIRRPLQSQDDSATKYDCSRCNSSFQKRFGLRKHLVNVHKIDQLYKCGDCNKDVFGDTASQCLVDHPEMLIRVLMKVPSTDIIYACPDCGKICHSKYDLKRHVRRMHKPPDPRTCEFCGKTYRSKEYLLKHINCMHVKERSHKCDQCDQIFKYAHILRNHIEQVHQKIRWQCEQCDNSYSASSSLKNHIALAHLKIKSFTCTICAKELKCKMSMERHVATLHSGVNKLKCNQCGQIFEEPKNLENHLKIDHTKFPCTQCAKSFPTVELLARHLNIKHIQKSNDCSKCDLKFSDANLLRTHKRSAHSTNKTYTCAECQRSFSESHCLRRHVRLVHLKEKRHVCEHCGKGFAIPFILRQHIQSAHLKEKKFECDVCGDAFTASHVLKKHKLRHVKKEEDHISD